MTTDRNTKALLLVLFAIFLTFAWTNTAFAAPLIPVGYGWADGPHSSNPGYCLNCHTGFAAGSPPAIASGATPTHNDRGGTCTLCHTVVTPPPVPVTRLAGVGRYATSIEISKRAYPTTAPAVVLATGVTFPDALCAGPLAKAYGGPILLSPVGTTLDASVTAEVTRLHPSTILIVGSTVSIAQGVEDAARALPWSPTVTRITGADQYETAANVAAAVKAKLGSISKVVLASGVNFPDALSVAALASDKGWPILFTRPTDLPTATAGAVTNLGATFSIVVGGPLAISDAVMALMPSPSRLGKVVGSRYDTCALIAEYATSQGMNWTALGLATGIKFPDALSSAPLLAQSNSVLMLTPPTGVAAPITAAIAAHKSAVKGFLVFGADNAVPRLCVNAAVAALK